MYIFLKFFHNKNGDDMKKEEYQQLVDKHVPKENKTLNALKAFVIGGLFGVLGNFLLELCAYLFDLSKSDASVLMITTLIFFACLFTALGFFDSFVKFGRMGVIIPITGFAHSMQSATLDYKKEGLVYGFGANMFKLAGAVILYGVLASCIFGLLRLIIMGG